MGNTVPSSVAACSCICRSISSMPWILLDRTPIGRIEQTSECHRLRNPRNAFDTRRRCSPCDTIACYWSAKQSSIFNWNVKSAVSLTWNSPKLLDNGGKSCTALVFRPLSFSIRHIPAWRGHHERMLSRPLATEKYSQWVISVRLNLYLPSNSLANSHLEKTFPSDSLK